MSKNLDEAPIVWSVFEPMFKSSLQNGDIIPC
jgi:hypothetical protein